MNLKGAVCAESFEVNYNNMFPAVIDGWVVV